jgi:dTDP-glucose pyrophosphorylase
MMDWREVLISPDATLSDAMKAIESGSLRIALVADAQGALLGVVTDGDIRRGLLREVSISMPVSLVMNKNPKTVGPATQRSVIRLIMEENDIYSIPVTQDNIIVGLETVRDLLTLKRRDNPVFLMAGGFGSRLKSLTQNCPKPMLKVGGKPLLELIINNFISAGFHRFYISTHYKSEMIREYFGNGSQLGIDISYVHESTPLGTAGALGLLPRDEIDKPMFMMNGDLLTTLDFQNLLNFHESNSCAATMCVREYSHTVPYGVVESTGHEVSGILEKPSYKYFINAGIYMLSPEMLLDVPYQQRIDMPEFLLQQINKNVAVSSFPLHEYWLDIGRAEDFERAQEDIINL